jgi:hypothetical protein
VLIDLLFGIAQEITIHQTSGFYEDTSIHFSTEQDKTALQQL